MLATDQLVEEMEKTLDLLPAGAYLCNTEGLIIYYNDAAAALWGRKPLLNDRTDSYCGSFKLYSIEGAPISHTECWMALALFNKKEYVGKEIIVEQQNGKKSIVLAHAKPLYDSQGVFVGAVNILVDITERKRFEEALIESDKRKDEFLAVLAHELRNPLSPISSAAQILHLKGSSSDEGQWALSVIDRQMRHMSRLIEDLLDVARITGNKIVLRKERIDLRDVLNAAIETTSPQILENNHEFIPVIPQTPIYIEGDLVRLAQVIENILSNAAKYTPRGGTIGLSTRYEKDSVVITIVDSGVGISPEIMPRIFDMFTQGNREGSSSGLGIGLTIVKRLLEMHGGSVMMESEGSNKGSTCTVRLPLIKEDAIRLVSTIGQDFSTAFSNLRILIVDDNVDAAATMDTMLKLLGNETYMAHDGLEAIEKAEKYRPDVVLLDIGMPKMNGYEAASAIRSNAWGAKMTLLALTGWGQNSDKELSKEAGFDYHLTKPVDVSVLTRLLSSIKVEREDSRVSLYRVER